MERATITNKAQAQAMEKVLKGTGLSWAFIGWTPRLGYAAGKVGHVRAPSHKVLKDADQLDDLLGRSIGWRSCDGQTTYYGGNTDDDKYETDYDTEFDDGDSYYSGRRGYTSDYATIYEHEYSYSSEGYNTEYTSTYGNSEYTSSPVKCSALIMKRSGKVYATLKNRADYIKTNQLCMYEVPERNKDLKCPNVIGNGYCRFADPTNVQDRAYHGDFTVIRSISEEECYRKCLKSTYCKAYEFYGNSESSGTCELHYDKPIDIKENKKKVSKCVQMVKSSACNNRVDFGTLAPTKAPTKAPTQRPTSFPTKSPTPFPTSPTPAPTELEIVATESDFPACPNNMILTQCFKPACEKKCSGSDLDKKCPDDAERAFIVLPSPQDSYTHEEESAFLQTYCRCPDDLILDEATRQCVKNAKDCSRVELDWSDKCQTPKDNVVIELSAYGYWIKLETNEDKKYENDADLCWIIRAPADKLVSFQIIKGGKTQANKDILEVWDVTSTAEATFEALAQGQIDTVLRDTFDGKVKATETLEAQAQQMLVRFSSDRSKFDKGFEFWVRAKS
ncbi:Hypothetical Protein FCC1311_069922 [Hondaea fermentalgiana]|uniref:Apple domain-containing protein n=1 Tax=Hondaea fermentalgiana TaxID=2315210 RepID=A0A2R5GIQ6_9STRA|nr:Hypothetical Protein FCC1311_069922 [Hondaea fermentalgiana]|eukprot:GBG30772.1 Hypothetical Protein FCC1311_069922 [Hondaea fermentalgiana]